MELKFYQFYYNGALHSINEFMPLFMQDRKMAYDKYNGKIFCPMCYTAPLTIVAGLDKCYFRVSHSNMYKHHANCSYRLEEASPHQSNEFYEQATDNDIQSLLQSCVNKMLKGTVHIDREKNGMSVNSDCDFSFLTIKIKRGKKAFLPNKLLTHSLYDDDLNMDKLFYGKCRVYWNRHEDYKYLNILHENYKLICSIKATNKVYRYLSRNIKDIADSKEHSELHYICFVTKLEKKNKDGKIYYNGSLRRSSCIIII